MANRQKPDNDDRPPFLGDGDGFEEPCEDIDMPEGPPHVMTPEEAERWRRWSAEADADLLAEIKRAIAEQARD